MSANRNIHTPTPLSQTVFKIYQLEKT